MANETKGSCTADHVGGVFSFRRKRYKAGFRILGVVLCGGILPDVVPVSAAQACKPPDPSQSISTDRPTYTNASTTVPCRTLQFENGIDETAVQGQRSWDLPATVARFGATTKTELRFTAPDYFWNTASGSMFATGMGDLAVGVKQQLGPVYGFDLAAIGTVSFPTGAQSVSSHGYDVTLQVPWSHKLPNNWTAEGMFSVAWPTQNGKHNATGQATAVFDRALTKTLDGFVEYAGTFPSAGGPQHIVDFGGTYKVTRNQQVDLHGGVGLSAAAVDHVVGAGYSVRFDLYRGR